ncbi:MAG: DUF11 domain-containing protein [Rhodanobacter sp.]|nr:DUF11 domain-containing protein [Rhodanobacter sp.]
MAVAAGTLCTIRVDGTIIGGTSQTLTLTFHTVSPLPAAVELDGILNVATHDTDNPPDGCPDGSGEVCTDPPNDCTTRPDWYTCVGPTPVVQPTSISITKTSANTQAIFGQPVTYTVTVTNAGPTSADGTTVSDPIPDGLTTPFNWTCTSSGGATCTASGSDALSDVLTSFPSGSQAVYTITATMANTTLATITNIATATPPPRAGEPVSDEVTLPVARVVPPTPITPVPALSLWQALALALMLLLTGIATQRMARRRMEVLQGRLSPTTIRGLRCGVEQSGSSSGS